MIYANTHITFLIHVFFNVLVRNKRVCKIGVTKNMVKFVTRLNNETISLF